MHFICLSIDKPKQMILNFYAFYNTLSVSLLSKACKYLFQKRLYTVQVLRNVNHVVLFTFLTAVILFASKQQAVSQAKQSGDKIEPLLDACNVSWNKPGPTSAQSMPIGNGDIGLNVWVENNGDLAFYISKTDAWGEGNQEQDPWMKQGGVLMKLGLVKVSLSPSPFKSSDGFKQVLKLRTGQIEVSGSQSGNPTVMRIWVDANHPAIYLQTTSKKPLSYKVKLENWRLNNGDTVLSNRANQIIWYHHNGTADDPHLANIAFGATIKAQGMVSANTIILRSQKPVTAQKISIYPLTAKAVRIADWQHQLDKQTAKIEKLNMQQAWQAHQHWWQHFWHRSWIYVQGDTLANKVTQGYVLQRFVTACAGRGAYPIKFNGSIFVVDNPSWKPDANIPATSKNADFRAWGGQYWFQNTRAMYWPRLMAGDFDMMLPLFKMYTAMLPDNAQQVKQYYHHNGAYFAETAPFWGGLKYWGPEANADWTGHYFTPVLELSMMMLDYYEYTGDKQFARQTLIPVATAGLQFFDEHFKRDSSGKILLDPDNSIEMFWKVYNPAPDIAGLHAVLARMLHLPVDLMGSKQLDKWKKMQSELPVLPVGKNQGKDVLLPYTGLQTAQSHNSENPEPFIRLEFMA
jgi:alpha-L-fucosidase 2